MLEDVSTSFPFPFPFTTVVSDDGAEEFVAGSGGGDGVAVGFPLIAEPVDPAANCHAGIEGLPSVGSGEEGWLGMVGPRLINSAFKDFSSC